MSKRIKTPYPGVYYRQAKRMGGKGTERVYYIVFKKNGKVHEEKVGRQFVDDITPARAARIRSERIEGKRLSRKEIKEKQAAVKAKKMAKWTIGRLFDSYMKSRKEGKSKGIDRGRYGKYLEKRFSKKEPNEITILDIQKLKNGLRRKNLSPQTQKHVLNLLTWIINYGVKNGLCEGLPFKIKKPTVNNEVTEYLTDDQLRRLMDTIKADPNVQVANMMVLALYTGMRRGELFRLQWDDINFDQGFIHIRDPKGGIDQKIPLNTMALELLESHPRSESLYVFPGKYGGQRVSVQAAVKKIKKNAGLPDKFRPLHGLRHAFATNLASSGKIDLYTLQKLLTHKDGRMTQRYAHLRDEALKRASNLAGDIIQQAISGDSNDKVISLEDREKN